MPLTKDERQKLDETHDSVIRLEVMMNGMVKQVGENTKRSVRNSIIIAGIVGSGALGGGVYGLIQLLM